MQSMARREDVQLPVRVRPELLEAIDMARGDVSRTRWVTRALESALGERPAVGHSAVVREVAGSTPVTPAPTRTPRSSTAHVDLGERDALPKPAAIKRGSAVELRYICPWPDCVEGPFGSAAAVCPAHGRKAVLD